MPPTIRSLDPIADAEAVTGLFRRAADYVLLETGLPPTAAETKAFFTDAPPGGDPQASLKLGLFLPDGQLAAIADVGFGYPEAGDAYIGLMLTCAAHRSRGLGARLLDHIVAEARARHAPRLLLAVLEENPRGRAFWERMGFCEVLKSPPARLGLKTHVRYRMARRL